MAHQRFWRWHADWRDEDGKRHRKSFPTRALAEAFETRMRKQAWAIRASRRSAAPARAFLLQTAAAKGFPLTTAAQIVPGQGSKSTDYLLSDFAGRKLPQSAESRANKGESL